MDDDAALITQWNRLTRVHRRVGRLRRQMTAAASESDRAPEM